MKAKARVTDHEINAARTALARWHYGLGMVTANELAEHLARMLDAIEEARR